MIKKINSGYQVITEEGEHVAVFKTEDKAKERLDHIKLFRLKEELAWFY